MCPYYILIVLIIFFFSTKNPCEYGVVIGEIRGRNYCRKGKSGTGSTFQLLCPHRNVQTLIFYYSDGEDKAVANPRTNPANAAGRERPAPSPPSAAAANLCARGPRSPELLMPPPFSPRLLHLLRHPNPHLAQSALKNVFFFILSRLVLTLLIFFSVVLNQ